MGDRRSRRAGPASRRGLRAPPLVQAETARDRAEQARQAAELERATLLGRLDELERDRTRMAREARTGGRTLFSRPGDATPRVEELSQQLDHCLLYTSPSPRD